MDNRGCPIQTLRTDKGTEYASKEIQNFLKINGITHAPTGRAAHAKMHVAWRMNRTIMEIARSMLIDSGLDKHWWVHTVFHATNIRNRCTESTFLNKETPHGRVFSKESDLKVFRPFGCTALIYIPLQNGTKRDVTAERGFVVGMAEVLLWYKVYCYATKSIVHARDVQFIEEPDEKLFIDDEIIGESRDKRKVSHKNVRQKSARSPEGSSTSTTENVPLIGKVN